MNFFNTPFMATAVKGGGKKNPYDLLRRCPVYEALTK